jgi:hypothetical protein
MKTFKLLILILTLFSFQAGATGYAHNMFVAHRKLQACKETVSEKVAVKKAKPAVKLSKQTAQVKQASFVHLQLTSPVSETATLNERILEEGPISFFNGEKDEEGDESIVTKLVTMVRCVISSFIGAHLS